jgi:predicted acyltransferase
MITLVTPSRQSGRLSSLDTFRGMTIAGMILVNLVSLSKGAPAWLTHAVWNGWTVADCVFPFFLFIVGVALAFSLPKYQQRYPSIKALYFRILKRGLLLFLLGLLVNGFWQYQLGSFSISGVLQRIGLVYVFTALIALKLSTKAQIGTTVLLLGGYWLAYILLPVPDPSQQSLGTSPIGIGTFGIISLFSMLSSAATTLIGYLTGTWLHRQCSGTSTPSSRQSMTLVLFGVSSYLLGDFWGLWLPINKKLWTSSYTLLTVGLALMLLAACYELIEVRGYTRWSQPLQFLGLNSLFAFITSELIIKLMEKLHIGNHPNAPTLYTWIQEHFWSSQLGESTSSLLLAGAILLLVWSATYLLYRKRWFLAV